jgi:peptidoglycan/xylan/chitin deacetylase (PgdA/CDA1 family)
VKLARAIAKPRALLRRTRARGVVLCYHRVASLDRDPQLLAVAPERFAEQLVYLSEHFEPVPLARIHDPEPSALPRIAITFDDGYADNLIAAKPLLEEQRVPATVFICTGNLGSRREFWWDELERILLEPATLPARLETTVGDVRIAYDLSDDNNLAPAWNVLDRLDPSPRHALYRELASLIRPLPTEARDSVLAELRAWAGLVDVGRESHRSLTEREVAMLVASPYVEIGAHTVSHPVLACQTSEAQLREIETSRDVLQELTGQPVDSFAYPYGGAADYSSTTVRTLRETGLTLACTTTPGPVTAETDPLRVPRILVRDWGTAELRRRLTPFVRT